jgi:predicted ArsR family transcriptional regulator
MTAFARRTDPASSHEAAASMAEAAPVQDARIVAALRDWGPMAAEQIAAELGDLDMVQVCRRIATLKREGKVEVHEPLGHTNRSGRRADILAAVRT